MHLRIACLTLSRSDHPDAMPESLSPQQRGPRRRSRIRVMGVEQHSIDARIEEMPRDRVRNRTVMGEQDALPDMHDDGRIPRKLVADPKKTCELTRR